MAVILPNSANQSLGGKVAVVTGAAGAIGGAVSRLFLARGARVLAVDRAGADFAALHQAAAPGSLATQAADVTDEGQVVDYVARAQKEFGGRIDIFFNNAGIEGPVRRLPDYSLAEFRAVMAVNVEGVFLGLKHVLPVMLAQQSGSAINTASTGGLRGAPGVAGYVASKHAVIGLTRVAALECAPAGVRVNCICPGPTRGRMIDSLDQAMERTEAMRSQSIPARRYGLPEEVAALVAFLASDDAIYVNGAAHTIDGASMA